ARLCLLVFAAGHLPVAILTAAIGHCMPSMWVSAFLARALLSGWSRLNRGLRCVSSMVRVRVSSRCLGDSRRGDRKRDRGQNHLHFQNSRESRFSIRSLDEYEAGVTRPLD